MTAVTAKMNGLQVLQSTEFYNFTNYPANTTSVQKQSAVVGDVSICNPQYLRDDLFQPNSTGTDDKFYFRQEKLTGYLYNNTSCEVLVDLYYMKCRKNINKLDFPQVTTLLTENAIATNWWMTNVTSGNTAQRYLKFGKHKRFVLRTGRCRKFSFRGPKFPANKQISQDVEGSDAFLGVKNFTRFCVLKFNPMPFIYRNTALQVDPAPTAQVVDIGLVVSRYTSWYKVGSTDPKSIYSKDFGTPAAGFAVNPHVWTDVTDQNATVSQ